MQKRWKIKPQVESSASADLADELNISTTLASLLIQREITSFDEAKAFFRPQIDEIHDPFLMKDMDKAVARVENAISANQKILVYGDYDVDGTTAVSLMYSFLSTIYDNLEYYIPNRYTEGYGISNQGIDYAAENNFKLIIALDCGIKAIDKITYAKNKGVDFIICDHHLPGETVPDASAVLDPKQIDCGYPYKELCGCGVGFKLVQAIAQKRKISFEELHQYFDLLAISIAADIVPITGENRVLAYYGMRVINAKPRTGIQTILDIAGLKRELSIMDVVFTISPRINAAGRIKSGNDAVKLLISGDVDLAKDTGKMIDENNSLRKTLDREITVEALALIENDNKLAKAKTSVLYNENWHKGVIGIVASRLIETYYRPTIILTKSNGKATGSARSVKGFNVHDAISQCGELLEQYGGHKYAAGLTMPIENIEAFQNKFEKIVANSIQEDQLTPEIEIDAEISLVEIRENPLDHIPKFYRILKQLAPFGPGNMKPVLASHNVFDSGYCKIVGKEHLKFTAIQKDRPEVRIPCIGFGMAEHYERIRANEPFSMAFVIDENTWNGHTEIQLNVKDIKFNQLVRNGILLEDSK